MTDEGKKAQRDGEGTVVASFYCWLFLLFLVVLAQRILFFVLTWCCKNATIRSRAIDHARSISTAWP